MSLILCREKKNMATDSLYPVMSMPNNSQKEVESIFSLHETEWPCDLLCSNVGEMTLHNRIGLRKPVASFSSLGGLF